MADDPAAEDPAAEDPEAGAAPPIRQVAVYRSEKASRYLQQLCKHFAHKVEVEYDETRGHAVLPGGEVHLAAEGDALTITVEGATPPEFVKARYIVEEHLLRFAFREAPQPLDWIRA